MWRSTTRPWDGTASGSIGTLAEIVDAHRYVDSGHKVGNVVITVVAD